MLADEFGGGAGGQDTSQGDDATSSGGTGHDDAGAGASGGSQGAGGAQGGGGAAAPDFGGLPFKDTTALVGAFKDLQRSLGTKDTQYKNLQTQVQGLVKQLAGQFNNKPAAQVSTETADAFLKRFLADPKGTLAEVAKETARAHIDENVNPRFSELDSLKTDNSVTRFLNGAGKDLDGKQQERFLQILDEKPWILQTPNPLQTALSELIAEDPAGYSKAIADKRTAAQADLDAAKGAAGLGGKRTSSQKGGGGDAFDQVLSLNKATTLKM